MFAPIRSVGVGPAGGMSLREDGLLLSRDGYRTDRVSPGHLSSGARLVD